MPRYKKCVICNENIINESGVPYKGRYAHQKCFNIAIQTLQKDKKEKQQEKVKKKGKTAKPQAELKEALSEEEYQKKKKFFEYLRELLNDDLPSKVYVVTEGYIKKYNYTYENMYLTLVYLSEIKEKDLHGDIVGIIPYYYDEALSYQKSVQKVEEINRDIDVSGMYNRKTIYIRPKQRRRKQLNIENITKGE